MSARGTVGPPAVTMIASYGACSAQPSVPSPQRTWTLPYPRAARRSLAESAKPSIRSTVYTSPAISERTAAP
jgi:hypothetical protein